MKKRLVLATSTSCLDCYPIKHNVKMISIRIFIYDKSYLDGSEIKATDFYKMLRDDKDLLPTTSQPSVGELIEMFEGYQKEGYEEIFIVTISNKLSGTYNSIKIAASEFEGSMKITVYDSYNVFSTEGYFALVADNMYEEGKTTEEVIATLDELRKKSTIFFVCEDLNNLIKNGRLSGAKAFFGKLLKIKPVLQVIETGQIVSIDKQRTTIKAIDSMLESAKEFIAGRKFKLYHLFTSEELCKKVQEAFDKKFGKTEAMILPGSPVVGAHIGPYGAGIGIVIEE